FYQYVWTNRAADTASADGVPTRVVKALAKLKARGVFARQDQFQIEVSSLLSSEDAKKYSTTVLRVARELKPRKFIAFCKRHPQFVRRLRERCIDHLTEKP